MPLLVARSHQHSLACSTFLRFQSTQCSILRSCSDSEKESLLCCHILTPILMPHCYEEPCNFVRPTRISQESAQLKILDLITPAKSLLLCEVPQAQLRGLGCGHLQGPYSACHRLGLKVPSDIEQKIVSQSPSGNNLSSRSPLRHGSLSDIRSYPGLPRRKALPSLRAVPFCAVCPQN